MAHVRYLSVVSVREASEKRISGAAVVFDFETRDIATKANES